MPISFGAAAEAAVCPLSHKIRASVPGRYGLDALPSPCLAATTPSWNGVMSSAVSHASTRQLAEESGILAHSDLIQVKVCGACLILTKPAVPLHALQCGAVGRFLEPSPTSRLLVCNASKACDLELNAG